MIIHFFDIFVNIVIINLLPIFRYYRYHLDKTYFNQYNVDSNNNNINQDDFGGASVGLARRVGPLKNTSGFERNGSETNRFPVGL